MDKLKFQRVYRAYRIALAGTGSPAMALVRLDRCRCIARDEVGCLAGLVLDWEGTRFVSWEAKVFSL